MSAAVCDAVSFACVVIYMITCFACGDVARAVIIACASCGMGCECVAVQALLSTMVILIDTGIVIKTFVVVA